MNRLKEEVDFDYFDSQRKERINDILNKFFALYKENVNILNQEKYLKNGIYNYLIGCDLKSGDYDCIEYIDDDFGFKEGKKVVHFNDWINHFQNVANIEVFCSNNWKEWCQFKNGKETQDEFIKLYIPFDSKHIEHGVTELFEFLAQNNIVHQSKVGIKMRTDGTIVRLNNGDYSALHKTLDFLRNNENFQQGKNLCNPLLPTVEGVGVIAETGISYNGEMAEIISSFIKKHSNDKNVDFDQFCNEFDKLSDLTEVKNVFNCTIGRMDMITSENKTTLKKDESILSEALEVTFKKYGIDQIIEALTRAIENNEYGYFSGSNHRIALKNQLGSKKIHFCILKAITEFNTTYQTQGNVKEDVEEFVIGTYSVSKLDQYMKFLIDDERIEDHIAALISEDDKVKDTFLKAIIEKNLAKNLERIIKSSLTLKGVEFTDNDYITKYCDCLKEIRQNEPRKL